MPSALNIPSHGLHKALFLLILGTTMFSTLGLSSYLIKTKVPFTYSGR